VEEFLFTGLQRNVKHTQIEYENLDFEKLAHLVHTYCFSENKVNCALYKLWKTDKEVLKDLLPNSRRVNIRG